MYTCARDASIDLIRRNSTTPLVPAGNNNSGAWKGGVSVSSVDLIAMIVSDAGLQNAEPQWWNASPLGCVLIGLQPRGGWQVLQRATQWGNDFWANCFGVKCEQGVLYQYFACSMRNRLEVWNSDEFYSPMIGRTEPTEETDQDTSRSRAGSVRMVATESTLATTESRAGRASVAATQRSQSNAKTGASEKHWKKFNIADGRKFAVSRPTKLVDGSRGGQAFTCDLLLPKEGNSYGIEDQARMQFLSVVMVAVAVMKRVDGDKWKETLRNEFQIDDRLGLIFRRLRIALALANIVLAALLVTTFYALWRRNIFNGAVSHMIQICSLLSWAFGATGLLMLGGNPRIRIERQAHIPERFKDRLSERTEKDSNKNGQLIALTFGSLHGSIFTPDRGTCSLPVEVVDDICGWKLRLIRTHWWYVGMLWFLSFLGISIVLQIAGSAVSTLSSEVMGVSFLIITSIVRGQGLSGSEERMIPRWKMRTGAEYAVQLVGKMQSREGKQEVG